MIQNEDQYVLTCKQARKFRAALAAARDELPQTAFQHAAIEALECQLASLEQRLEQWENRPLLAYDVTVTVTLCKCFAVRGKTIEECQSHLADQYERTDLADYDQTDDHDERWSPVHIIEKP